MSSWFDKLLEEMQRRQMEQDRAREGRPLRDEPVGPPEEQIPDDEGGDVPPPLRRLRRRRRGGPNPAGNWARTVVLLAGAFVLLQLLGGLIQLSTDLAWYDALGRRDILLTRFVAHLGWFVAGFALFTIPALLSLWVAARLGPQVPVRRVGSVELPDLSRPVGFVLVALAVLGGWSAVWRGAGTGRRSCCSSTAGISERPTRPSAATSASTSSTCRSGDSPRAGWSPPWP